MENNDSNLDWMVYWSLPKYNPRNSQIRLINEPLPTCMMIPTFSL